ncbi:universal stress protein [Planktotalea arctica]|uniref:universal stress protein n=1 Tax=Planktotalea arctica TaxID=1481893 RepID=UPI000A175F67|nr:universal stress protein [Planktotalea arctica]
MFKKIVVAFDGSHHAEATVLTACNLAEKYDANLHVVHVPESKEQAMAVGASAVATRPHRKVCA